MFPLENWRVEVTPLSIIILGLGHGDPRALTLEARDVLAHAREIFLRTRAHPAVAALPPELDAYAFDDLPDADPAAIAEAILARAQTGDVIYAVPGHPLFGESSVRKILAQARAKQIATRVIAGTSFVDAACVALELDPLVRGLQIADATELARQHFPRLDPDQPTLIGQVHSREIARACLATLRVVYPPEHGVTRVDAAGTAAQRLTSFALAELDRAADCDWLTTIYVPPLARAGSLNRLGEVVAHLRAPDGCPWDREQTHQSLRKDFLEECYEVLETLDANDLPHLREELGDLLLHILLQAQIASEAGEFSLSEVVAEISEKLIRRHPHVFGDVKVNGTDEIIANWEQIKQAENGGKKKTKPSIPRDLPALARAQEIAHKAKTPADVRALAAHVEKLAHAPARAADVGEALFALVAFAESQQVDAETALRETANAKM